MAPIVSGFEVVQEESPLLVVLAVMSAVTILISLALVAVACACCAKKKEKETPITDEPSQPKSIEPISAPTPPKPEFVPQEAPEPSGKTSTEASRDTEPWMTATMKMNQAPDLMLTSKMDGNASYATPLKTRGGGKKLATQPSLMLLDQSTRQPKGNMAGGNLKTHESGSKPSSVQSSTGGGTTTPGEVNLIEQSTTTRPFSKTEASTNPFTKTATSTKTFTKTETLRRPSYISMDPSTVGGTSRTEATTRPSYVEVGPSTLGGTSRTNTTTKPTYVSIGPSTHDKTSRTETTTIHGAGLAQSSATVASGNWSKTPAAPKTKPTSTILTAKKPRARDTSESSASVKSKGSMRGHGGQSSINRDLHTSELGGLSGAEQPKRIKKPLRGTRSTKVHSHEVGRIKGRRSATVGK